MPGDRAVGQDGLPGHLLHGPRFEVDEALRIVGWSYETEQRTGIRAAQALGRHCWELIHPGARSKPEACETLCLAVRSASSRGRSVPPHEAPCAAMPLPDSRGGAIVWMPVEANDDPHDPRPDPLERILLRGGLSESLGDVGGMLDFLRRYTAADDCELFLVDDTESEVLHTACVGPDIAAFRELTRIPLGAGYPGGVTARQRPMLTNDFQNDRIFLRGGVRRCGIRSFLGVPLARQGRPLGYLGLGWRDSRVTLEPLVYRLEGLEQLLLAGLPREPSRKREPEAALHLRCFGSFEVRVRGEALPAGAFTRRKALTLLKLLALRAPAPVHREVLIDHLWPDADAHRGANRLHGVVHALRQALGDALPGGDRFVVHEGDSYFLAPSGSLSVDLWRFRARIESASRRSTPAADVLASLEEAVELYEGGLFADDPYTEWLDAPRALAREQYLRAVRELAGRYSREERVEDARRVLEQAITRDPMAEDLLRGWLRSLDPVYQPLA